MIIKVFSDGSLRWRPVGTMVWHNISGGVTHRIEVDAGESIEIGSRNPNNKIDITGDVSRIQVTKSKLNNLTNSFQEIKTLEHLEVHSDATIDEANDIASGSAIDTIIVEPLYSIPVFKNVKYSGAYNNENNFEYSDVSEAELRNVKFSNLEKIHGEPEVIDILDYASTQSIDGGAIKALDSYLMVKKTRHGSAVLGEYNKKPSADTINKTFEMDIKNITGTFISRRDNKTAEAINVHDINADTQGRTFEMDIKNLYGTFNSRRDNKTNEVIEAHSTVADVANQTFEMDIKNLYGTFNSRRDNKTSQIISTHDTTSDTANQTFEMDFVNIKGTHTSRRVSYSNELFDTIDTNADTANYTFEMDFVGLHHTEE